ncbi:MAG: hypothetical protein LBG42_00295 [Treponema sp.]|jgi:hypothetical protein|nr:hypothetical protein [Treponema sp.]
MTTDLTAVRSHKTITGTPPLDEQNRLDLYREKYELETAPDHLKQSDDEHKRFMAEWELSNGRFQNPDAGPGTNASGDWR